MNGLILPAGTLPSNIRLRNTIRTTLVESDLYDIGRRLQELHPSLYAVQLDEGGDDHAWAIMEDCEDGVQRLVFKTKALDQRVIEKMQRIINVPFEQRFKAAEEDEAKHNAQQKENELEMLYERMGRPMWTQLEHDGFIQRNTSYAKRGMYGKVR
jgi:hypothetical protein